MKISRIITLCIAMTAFLLTNAAGTKHIETISFKVSGNCEMCKERIEEALDVKGVKKADWNMETGMVTIVFDPHTIEEDQLHQLIAKAGYDTEKVKAEEKAYKELPGCCQYSRKK